VTLTLTFNLTLVQLVSQMWLEFRYCLCSCLLNFFLYPVETKSLLKILRAMLDYIRWHSQVSLWSFERTWWLEIHWRLEIHWEFTAT
jgi:hypothetical protein